MKKMLAIFLLLSFSFCSNAQNHLTEIKEFFKTYAAICEAGEWNKSLDHVHPSLFELMPRDKMEELLESSLKTDMFSIDFKNLSLMEISDVFVHEDRRYSNLRYEGEMIFNILDESDDDVVDMLVKAMSKEYGKKNVKLMEGSKIYIHINDKTAFMMQDPNQDWKILEYKTDNMKLLNALIPKEVRSHFNMK